MSKTALLVIALALPVTCPAGVLLHEAFDYDLADGASMNGVATGASGLSGSYAIATAGGHERSGAFFRPVGLSFGANFVTSGGAVVLSAFGNDGSNGSVILGAELNAGMPTGTIYNSYLVSFESRTAASTASLRINVGATTPGGSAFLVSNAKHAGATNQSSVDYDVAGAAAAVSTTHLANRTPYFFVNRFTDVGRSGGVATTWVLDVDGYDALLEGGSFSEADLDVHTLVKFSQPAATKPHTLNGTRFMQFGSSSGMIHDAIQIAVFDEIRYGTQLADVLSTIPEPSIYAGISAAGSF